MYIAYVLVIYTIHGLVDYGEHGCRLLFLGEERLPNERELTPLCKVGTHCCLVPVCNVVCWLMYPLLFNLSLFLPLFILLSLSTFWSLLISELLTPLSLPPSLPLSLSPSLLPTGSTKRRIEVLTISDIEKEYLLVRAKLRLLLRDQTMTTQLSSKKHAMVCCYENCSTHLCMCMCACICVCAFVACNGCCLATKSLIWNNTKWNGWRW